MVDHRDVYKGRSWLLSIRNTPLEPIVRWCLRRPSPYRAMIVPTVISLVSTGVCYWLLRFAATDVIPPAVGIGLTLLVFWPLALLTALGADIIQKEYKLRKRLEDRPR
ncbi:hypothetical protein RBH26_03335 [Natronolimnohabitans sp. A-GB9]|uniref:hypothetical protein n=1 Tax=Natronolimnohabitans sp. A-GB9 TaxID=3069757 RepID=UPI0027B74CA5|nr:hypothetical protein [Natronolimnohabitans sp. A-GB9]MDQ2049509.1 hypothetical protein [Natronolimnohabitans sp. A-GB9]